MKKSDLISDDKIENIKQKPFDHYEETKPEKPKWMRWVKVIIDFITEAVSFQGRRLSLYTPCIQDTWDDSKKYLTLVFNGCNFT